MAYDPSQLALLKNTGRGPDLWSYNTNDSPGFVKGVGYFNVAAPKLNPGDFIFCESGDGSLTTMNFVLVVTSTAGGIVAVAGKTVDV